MSAESIEMKRLFLLLLVVWVSYLHAQISTELRLFHDFINHYKKPYTDGSDEFNTRFLAFKVLAT